MAIKLVDITDEEIKGLETREIRIPIKKLGDYILENGFEHEGIWYFRKSWIKPEHSRLFEQSGLVEKAETINHLRDTNIPVPFEGEHGSVKIYRISNDKLNKVISKKKQNGKTTES